jgi:ParB family chromosome partitioning protein
MNGMVLPDFAMISIDTILIEDRSRDVSPVWVDALAAMFRDSEMLHPIILWESSEGPRLVAGAHRIAAQQQNGKTHIAAKWSQAKSLAEAKVLEITENIGRRELSALDRAQHLFDLKEAYEALRPEAKAGGDNGNQHTGGKSRQNEIISFCQDTADKIGLSDRAIQLAVAMWKGLSTASKSTAKSTWLADHQAGLMQLAKQTTTVQAKALALIWPPNGKQAKATNVADALFILENGRAFTSVEKRFSGLNRTIGSLADEELDAVLTVHEERIMAWVERRIGGDE